MNLAKTKRLVVFRSLAGTNVLTWLKEKINENSKLVYVLVGMLGVGIIATSPDALRAIDSLLTSPVVSAPMQQKEDRWEERAPMPTPRTCLTSKILGDFIYCIGGAINNQNLSSIVETYDIKNNIWIKISDINSKKALAASVSFNNKILLFGGHNGNTSLSTIEEYDPTTNTWQQKKPMPFEISYISGSVVTYKGKIYLVGGFNDKIGTVSEAHEYDPTNETWKKLPNLPAPRDSGAVCIFNDKMFYIGGTNGNAPMDNVYEYDFSIKKWSEKQKLPIERCGHTIEVIGKKIYVIGGHSLKGTVATIDVYDPEKDSWGDEIKMPNKGRSWHSSVTKDNEIFIIGGTNWWDGMFLVNVKDFLNKLDVLIITPSKKISKEGNKTTTWGYLK